MKYIKAFQRDLTKKQACDLGGVGLNEVMGEGRLFNLINWNLSA